MEKFSHKRVLLRHRCVLLHSLVTRVRKSAVKNAPRDVGTSNGSHFSEKNQVFMDLELGQGRAGYFLWKIFLEEGQTTFFIPFLDLNEGAIAPWICHCL